MPCSFVGPTKVLGGRYVAGNKGNSAIARGFQPGWPWPCGVQGCLVPGRGVVPGLIGIEGRFRHLPLQSELQQYTVRFPEYYIGSDHRYQSDSDSCGNMSDAPRHDMEMDAEDQIDANDVEGAQRVAPEQHQDAMEADEGDGEYDHVLQRVMGLSFEEQQLLALHLPAPVDADPPRAPVPLQPIPVPQQAMSSSQRPPERAIPPPAPAYDGSTNWPVYSIRVQQWLTACSTPPEQWGIRAFACVTGDAATYINSELKQHNLTYYDLQIDPTRFSWQDFDAAMQSGNFGSPPTDDSVRSKLLSYQQLKHKGMYNTAQHVSRVLLILQEAPHQLDDHTAIWLIRHTLYPALQQKMQLTAADQPFESLQQFLTALRNMGSVVDREEHEAAKEAAKAQPRQQQPQQQQAGYKRSFAQGPGAAPNPAAGAAAAAAAAGGSSSVQHPQAGQPFRPPPQQRQQGSSPHVGKATFNPGLSPAEVARRRRENRCFHCNALMGRLSNHAPTCKFRLQRESERGSGGEGGKGKGKASR